MKDTNKEVKAFLVARLGNKATMKQIQRSLAILKKEGIYANDDSGEYGYLNVHIRTADGMVRIYKHPHDGICVQAWKQTQVTYSGIPTFFGGSLVGRKER